MMNNNVYLRNTDRFSLMSFRILVVLIWTQKTVLTFVSEVMERLPLVGFIAPIFVPTLIIAMIALSYRHILKHIKNTDVLLYLCIVEVTLGSIVFCKMNSSHVEAMALEFLILTFPMYFVGLAFGIEDSKTDLFWASLASVVAMVSYQFYFILSGRMFEGNSSMYTAYTLLPSVLYLVYYAMNNTQKIYFLLAAISSACMLLFGSRGPVLVLSVFWCLCIFKELISIKSKGVKFFYLFIISISIFSIFYKDNFTNIMKFLSEFVEGLGFHTRVFDYFIEENITNDSGREALYDVVIQKISENPLFGHGMMSDRIFINELQNFNGINLSAYVHNLFLEIYCHWGVVLGTVVLMCMILPPMKALFVSNTKEEFYFILMFVCLVFIKLFLSSSYLDEANLYFLLGMAVNRVTKESNHGYYKILM